MTNKQLRIGTLEPGDIVTLRFWTSSKDFTDEQHKFIGQVPATPETPLHWQKDPEFNAEFESIEPSESTGKPYRWEAYRFNGRWCYGTSADRVGIAPNQKRMPGGEISK